MSTEYYQCGTPIKENELKNQFAITFAKAIAKHSYANLKHAVIVNGSEGIEFEAKPETVQYPVADIQKTERLCVVFSKSNLGAPQVLALRKNFPDDLPHLNLTDSDTPRNLCLFEQNYAEVSLTLTPERLLRRIFEWLHRATIDKLHLEDQPLEPFLLNSNIVIIDNEVISREQVDSILSIEKISKNKSIYKLKPIPLDNVLTENVCYVGLPIFTKPWHSRLINHTPRSIKDLHDMLAKDQCEDLIGRLKEGIFEILKKDKHKKLLELKWVLLIRLPKTRKPNNEIEELEDWAFFVDETIGELGCKLGVLAKDEQYYGQLLQEGTSVDLEKIEKIRVVVYKVHKMLDRRLAKQLADVEIKTTPEIAAIGAGSLGSHIIMNLARQGIGRWHIIDYDNLLPHNNARHALSPRYEGWNKAEALANEINILLNEREAATSTEKSIMEINVGSEALDGLSDKIDFIFDFSASQAALRYLSQLNIKTQIFSVYMLHGGVYIVTLCEGSKRKVRLADLELQLNVATLCQQDLNNLFSKTDENNVRYGGACSDVSTILPEDLVSLQSGIATSFIKKALSHKNPSINVWRLDANLNCLRMNVPVQDVYIKNTGGWNLRISDHVFKAIKQYRQEKLPNETGGVLVGAFDVPSKIVYVNCVLGAPPDSIEWPHSYIRGIGGLEGALIQIRKSTGDCLSYVGEWHSHPKGCSSTPSTDDMKAHQWIVEHMGDEGYPGIMFIQGDSKKPHILISDNC